MSDNNGLTVQERLKKMQAEKAAKHLTEVQSQAAQDGIKPDPTIAENAAKDAKILTEKKAERARVAQESVEALEKIRIFRSRIPNSRFIFEDGKEIFFTEGWYETTDQDEIRQLDAVANKVPTIYTDAYEKEIVAAIVEARKKGFTGTVAAMMTEQLSVEQRLNAIRHQGQGQSPLNLKTPESAIPSLLPPITPDVPTVDTEATLRAAIARASQVSNS